MRAALPLAFALLACGGPVDAPSPGFLCRTTCGLVTTVNRCDDVAKWERTAVSVLNYIYRNETTDVCSLLSGVTVEFKDVLGADEAGNPFVGLHYPGEHRIELAPTDAPAAVLTHELIHELDGVLLNLFERDHNSWTDRYLWIYVNTIAFWERSQK